MLRNPTDPVRASSRRLIILPTIGLLLLVPLAGCGFFADAGLATTEERSISGVTAVQLMTSGDLTITAGDNPTLTITAGAKQLPDLTSDVRNGMLILDNNNDMPRGDGISYALTVPSLQSLEVSGSGGVHGAGVLAGDAVVASSGSGSVQLSGVAVASMVVDISGSGEVELAGTATTQRVTSSGSGTYSGSALITRDSDVDISGSGIAQVNVTGTLTAESSGSGNVVYTGNPAKVAAKSTGSGSIGPQ